MRAIAMLAALLAAPVAAQHHGGRGQVVPTEHGAAHHAAPPAAASHGGHDAHAAHPEAAEWHGGHGHPAAASPIAGTDLPAGDAAPPPPPGDHYADRDYAPAAMARARDRMMREEGGRLFYQLLFNLAEVQVRDRARDGWRWDGQAWFGGDVDRLTLRSEGRGDFRGGVDDAEVQALWSHALDAYLNLQAGVRQDFEPQPRRSFATVGVEGLAPYWFQAEARLFLSTHGELLGRLEGWTDQRLTQRLVLQPRVELNFAAQDTRARRIGAGLSDAELGLRLRYEVKRQFAPYVGVSWDARTGGTARYARDAGERPRIVSLVSGVRFWF